METQQIQTAIAVDGQVKSIIDQTVRDFLRSRARLILRAVKTRPEDLHYCIVLQKDNAQNRSEIFEFFDKYDLLDIAEKHPVMFQFASPEFEHKFNFGEPIALAEEKTFGLHKISKNRLGHEKGRN